MVRQYILLVLSGLFFSVSLQAQELPKLGNDPAVRTGILRNGTHYKVVNNASSKGFANFALVQKVGTSSETDADKGKVVALSRDALAHTKRFDRRSPQNFLTSHGATPFKDGFVKVTDNATVYNFKNMRITSGEVVDSTLFLLCDIIERRNVTDDEFLKAKYSPSNSCIIVAGDVNPDEIIAKLQYMSLMTPSAEVETCGNIHKFMSSDSTRYEALGDTLSGISTIRAAYLSPRFPEEYMSTIQPAIYNMYVNELGQIMVNRFYRQGMNASFRHIDSANTDKDELFEISVTVPVGMEKTAIEMMAANLRNVAEMNIGLDEFVYARNAYLNEMMQRANAPFTANDSYVDRCISSFVYNVPVVSAAERYRFYSSRNIPDQKELELFGIVTSALVSAKDNMSLSCSSCTENGKLKAVFETAWNNAALSKPAGNDLTSENVFSVLPEIKKVKIKSDRLESMTGGRIWTFANGVKVIYKHLETSGKTYFNLALNGGMGSVQDLEYGEGAFLADYLSTRKIGEHKGADVMSYLARKSVDIHTEVYQGSTEISGSLPTDNIDLLLRYILAIANDGEMDEVAFREYMENEKALLSLPVENINERIDSILCPDYLYTPYKKPGVLSETFAFKADKFYNSLFSRINDGVLVMVSDIKEDVLKKKLQEVVGHFKTTSKLSPRPVTRYSTPSGWLTYTVDGSENVISFVMSAPLVLSADNVVATMVAANLLYQNLSEALVETGMYIDLDYNCHIYPQERVSVMITVGESNPDGFASYTRQTGSIAAVSMLRSSLSNLLASPVPDDKLEADKLFVKNYFTTMFSDPVYICNSIVMRYVDGKDFVTDSRKKTDAVTAEKVKDILKALNEGTKVEYIVKKK